VRSGPHGLGEYVTKSGTPHKAYVWDLLNHFTLLTLYKYRFTALLAGSQELLAYPADAGPQWFYNMWKLRK
jgi:hypothetical protein